MAVLIRRLEESDETANFDCGDAPRNQYLNKYAWANQEKSSLGVTYVAVEEAPPRVRLLHHCEGQRPSRSVSQAIMRSERF
jgi:hypothetical protein